MKPSATSGNFWRDLEELTAPEKFRARIRHEFLPGAAQPEQVDRRNFLKLMGASLALASLPACTRQPVEKIVPYVNQPENLVPGKPQFFATAMALNGFATGLLVESHEGHPTKIEGNPAHPASLGATSVFQQAALFNLYDPGRSQAVLNRNQPSTWDGFVAALAEAINGTMGAGGMRGSRPSEEGLGVRILTGGIGSPTFYHQIKTLLAKYPGARWHQFDGAKGDNAFAGSQIAFGELVETQYHFDKAKVVVSLDSDFLYAHPNGVRYAGDFSAWRSARTPQSEMNRLYVIESSPTVTGSNADHRLSMKAAEVANVATALAGQIGGAAITVPGQEQWISAVKEDLLKNAGRSIVIAGENQPPMVHALAHQMNHQLGNVGNTVFYTGSALAEPVNQLESFKDLCDSLAKDEVDVLLILGGNPAFDAPRDFEFSRLVSKARFCAHLSSCVNETSQLCDWHIPENHFLESWSDARAFDGTVSIIQPLIIPLYAGKTAHEVLDALGEPPGRSDYEIVRDFWKANNPGEDFEAQWRQVCGTVWFRRRPRRRERRRCGRLKFRR